MIAQYSSTFSLSAFTTFENVRRVACAYWGVSLSEFQLYFVDEKKNITDLGQETVKVLRFLETFGQQNSGEDPERDDAKKKKAKKEKEPKHSYAKFYVGRINSVIPRNASKNKVSTSLLDVSGLTELPSLNDT